MTKKEILDSLQVIQRALSESGIDSSVTVTHTKNCTGIDLAVYNYDLNGVKVRENEYFKFIIWPTDYFSKDSFNDMGDVVKNERLIHELMNRYVYKALMVVA